MKGNACPFYNLFHGLVYCATCGKSMQVRYEKVGRTGKNRFTGEMREPIDKAYYICQTYNRLGKNACTSHKIEARDLYNLVLKDIQELAAQAMKDADAFYQRLSSRMERRYLMDASQTEKERKRLEARNQEIDGMFLSLYTDKAKGVLTEQRFMKLTAVLEQEQEANQKRLHDLAVMQSRADAQESEVRTFIKEIRRYAAIEELDESVLNRLISKILIGEVKKVDGQKVQEVRIVYNFVGEIPEIAAVFNHQCFLPSIWKRVNKLCCCIFASPEKRFVALHIQLHIPTESIGQAYGLKTGGFLNVCVGKLLPQNLI